MRFLTLFFLVVMVSCGDDAPKEAGPVFDPSDVQGFWDMVKATRNGKETATLADTYFHFLEANELQTNIYGDDMKQALVWSDNTAVVADSSLTFKIEAVKADSLQLSFSLQRQNFQLTFVRTAE